jgi:hypothetical protein
VVNQRSMPAPITKAAPTRLHHDPWPPAVPAKTRPISTGQARNSSWIGWITSIRVDSRRHPSVS